MGEPKPTAQPPMTDTEMIDCLQRYLEDHPAHALLLHVNWTGPFPMPGLGLLGGRRTLRQAIAALAGRR